MCMRKEWSVKGKPLTLQSNLSPLQPAQAMFTSGMIEATQEKVSIKGVKPKLLGRLVNYAYKATVSISPKNVQVLY